MASPFRNLPAQRRLLDAIAAGEASGYDVMYGGGRFGSFADHPRQYIPIQSGPNAGKKSSAAGRYQFLAGTWDDTARELGLTDFSPGSQDAAAWHLAAKTYGAKTGRDLLADLDAGRTQDIASALSGVWTSIPGGIEPNKATGGFLARLGGQGGPSVASAGSPAPTGGILGNGAPETPMGLLASLSGQQQGQGVNPMLALGLLGGGQQEQPMQTPEMPAPLPKRPIDLTGLQALAQSRPRLGGAFSWG